MGMGSLRASNCLVVKQGLPAGPVRTAQHLLATRDSDIITRTSLQVVLFSFKQFLTCAQSLRRLEEVENSTPTAFIAPTSRLTRLSTGRSLEFGYLAIVIANLCARRHRTSISERPSTNR